MFNFVMADLFPIIITMILGYASGKHHAFTAEQSNAFNKLVLDYALPAALFVSITQANRDMLFADLSLTMVALIGILIGFFVAFICCQVIFKHSRSEGAVCALITGSPTIGFLGFAVLEPIYGASVSTGLVVAIVSIIVNAITIPIGLFLLNSDTSTADGKKSGAGLNALIASLKKPVVWSPILATVLVLVGFKLPDILIPSFQLISKTNSGVAVFAAGLTLAANKFEFDGEIIFNTIQKLIFMPGIILILGLMFKLDATSLQMVVLCGALPPAFSGTIIASSYNIYARTGTASMAVSILAFIIAAPIWISITHYIAA